jgi:hypothetical protein
MQMTNRSRLDVPRALEASNGNPGHALELLAPQRIPLEQSSDISQDALLQSQQMINTFRSDHEAFYDHLQQIRAQRPDVVHSFGTDAERILNQLFLTPSQFDLDRIRAIISGGGGAFPGGEGSGAFHPAGTAPRFTFEQPHRVVRSSPRRRDDSLFSQLQRSRPYFYRDEDVFLATDLQQRLGPFQSLLVGYTDQDFSNFVSIQTFIHADMPNI